MVHRQNIDNLKVVKKILHELTDKECSECAALGWRDLLNAQPKDYECEEEAAIEEELEDGDGPDEEQGEEEQEENEF